MDRMGKIKINSKKLSILVKITAIIIFITISSDITSAIFTVGKPSLFLIYVQNKALETDNYNITYEKEYTYHGDDLSHLIHVHLESDRIENLEPGKIRDTQGSIMILGPIFGEGSVTFNITSEKTDYFEQKTVEITGDVARALPEFNLIGFVQLFFLVGLVIFYSFHIR